MGFPGGPLVDNPPCNGGDIYLILGLGGSHTLEPVMSHCIETPVDHA